MPIDEHVLLWNSAHKTNYLANNARCSVYFPIQQWLTDVVGCRVCNVTIPNLFPNIYGMHRSLYIDFGGVVALILPEAHVTSASALDALLQPLIQAAVGGVVTVVTDADNLMTITSTIPFNILTPYQVKSITGGVTCLNELIGQKNNTTTLTTPYTFEDPVNLSGVRKVNIGSTQLASSRSIHANGDTGDVMCTLSMAETDYGFTMHREIEDSGNTTSYFRDTRQCTVIDMELTDEYHQPLTLPDNAHVNVEILITTKS